MKENLKTVMAIGGTDPCGGAGLSVDVRAISSLGLHPLCIVTAVTAQNSKGVDLIQPVSHDTIYRQIDSVLEEVTPEAIKIGIVGSVDNAEEIADFLAARPKIIPAVIDPVISATAGGNLFDEGKEGKRRMDLLSVYAESIFKVSTVVTPNLKEGEEILNYYGKDSKGLAPEEMAKLLLEETQSEAIVLKGGHSEKNVITDFLAFKVNDEIRISEFSHPRIECRNLHGSGCAFSSFLASYLAIGFPIEEAFKITCEFLHHIIENSDGYQLGFSDYGPLNINGYNVI